MTNIVTTQHLELIINMFAWFVKADVALIWFHNSTGLATCFNVKVKNLAFDTSKVITNAWFSMKHYGGCKES